MTNNKNTLKRGIYHMVKDLQTLKTEVLIELLRKNNEAIQKKEHEGVESLATYYELQHLYDWNKHICAELLRREIDNIKFTNDFKENTNVKKCLHNINDKLASTEKIINKLVNKYKMVLNAQQGNLFHYKAISISDVKPRAFSCMFVLGKHPNTPLSVETIYKLAGDYKIDGRGLSDVITYPKPSVIRAEIREAILTGTEEYRDIISKDEIRNLLDSSKQGKITLQVPQNQVFTIGPLDDIQEIVV